MHASVWIVALISLVWSDPCGSNPAACAGHRWPSQPHPQAAKPHAHKSLRQHAWVLINDPLSLSLSLSLSLCVPLSQCGGNEWRGSRSAVCPHRPPVRLPAKPHSCPRSRSSAPSQLHLPSLVPNPRSNKASSTTRAPTGKKGINWNSPLLFFALKSFLWFLLFIIMCYILFQLWSYFLFFFPFFFFFLFLESFHLFFIILLSCLCKTFGLLICLVYFLVVFFCTLLKARTRWVHLAGL